MIRPINSNVVVEQLQAENTTTGGIILPDSVKEKKNTGTVVAIGDGKVLDNGKIEGINLKVGDTIIYGYPTTEVEFEGKKYTIVEYSEIYAIID